MNNFENSKVKQICYHGTSSEPFTVLDKTKIQKDPEDGDAGYFGWGFYLTTDKSYAEEYGDTILAFKVNIQNPFDFNSINSKELVDFIFTDCKNLKLRVKETLRILYQIGREVLEFDADNSKNVLDKCKKLYNNYRDKEVNSSYIEDVKNMLIELAPNVNNWLNGLFFYFGRELFHYFTKHGYDGIIALGGKEIVVYETEQLQPVDMTNEDLELDIAEIPDWKAGAEEYTNKIKNDLLSHDGVRDVEIKTLYPLRQASVWWADKGIVSFKYYDLLEIYIYCGGEVEIYKDDNDREGITSVQDLEGEGIFTDDQYYEFMNLDDIWGRGLADNNTAYYGFIVTPIKNNPRDEEFYHYDLGYDDMYELNELFPCDWIFEDVIPDFMNDYPQFFEEEPAAEVVEEEVKSKKRVTKGQVLNDIIGTFGNISADKLTDAVYLLPNGNILDTKGPYDKSQHENVAKYISDKYHTKDLDSNQGSKLMQQIGAMRITPWIPAMFIPENILTSAQEKSLYDILLTLSSRVSDDSPLMLSTADGSQQIEYTKINNPEDIITDINGYQVFGILKA